MPDISRRNLLKLTAAGAVVVPGIAAAGTPGSAAAEDAHAPGRARLVDSANGPTMELTEDLVGTIVTPTSSDYASKILGWDQLFVHYPLVIVYPQNTQQVVNALTWARQNDVALRVRGGGHCLEGWSNVDNGIVIDISGLKAVQIDTDSRTATVGAGITQEEGVTALAAKNFIVPTGTEGTVGLAGATLGGGLGLFTRSLGMAVDFLIAAQVVVASGDSGAKVIKVDRNNHSDLLFALRGAGNGNFGIVTSLTYKVTRAPKVAFLSATWFPYTPDDLKQIFKAYQGTLSKDNRLGSELEFHPNAPGSIGIFLTAALPNGSEDDVRSILDSVLSLPTSSPPKVTVTVDNWGTIFSGFQLPTAQEPANWKFFSQFIKTPFPDSAIDLVNTFVQKAPTTDSNYFLCGYGGAVKKSKPSGGTAFPHRDALFYAEPGVGWGSRDPSNGMAGGDANAEPLTPVAQAWIAEFSQALRPFVDGAYVNVPNVGMQDWATAYWGSNFDRLRKIKTKYDPNNIFQYEQSIPPA